MSLLVRTGSIQEVVELSRVIPEFERAYLPSEFRERLRSDHVILVATQADKPVGFKVGYDRFEDRRTFYSWLGGVHPDFRKQGIGKLLLQKMEVWCKLKGYSVLQFKTMNRFRPMIHFAIDQGFDVVDFKPAKDPTCSKIYFEKHL